MNNRRLRQEYEETGSLMGILDDPEVLQEMVAAEAEGMGTIGAGFPAYSYHLQPVDPDKMRQAMGKVCLQSILFTELAVMMDLANLGAGTEAAITEARRRIRQQLTQLTTEQQAFLDAVVEEDALQSEDRVMRSQLRSRLYALLTPADWSAVGQAATNALQSQWTEFIKTTESVYVKKYF
jgi:hypothetical protein